MIITADIFCIDMDKYLDIVDNGEVILIENNGKYYRCELLDELIENK